MIPNSKNLKKITNQKLSIQISLSGLSFCILNTHTNKIFAFEQIEFKKQLNPFELLERLLHYFEIRDYLNTTFDDVLIIHENDLSTIVPVELFNENNLADYLKFNSKILKSDVLNYDTLHNNTGINIFVPYININNYIFDRFGSFTFKHFSTILINSILEKNTANSKAKIYVHICKNHFEIIILEHSTLKLYNTFKYNNPEDFLYYILFVIEQLNYNTETVIVELLGNISENDDIYSIAHKYIRHLHIMTNQNNYKIATYADISQSNFVITNSF